MLQCSMTTMTDRNSCCHDSFPCGINYVLCCYVLFIGIASETLGQNGSQRDKHIPPVHKYVGEDLIYECERNTYPHINEAISYESNGNVQFEIRRCIKNITVQLNMKLYEFDNGSQIDCYGQKRDIIVEAIAIKTPFEIYKYNRGNSKKFYCKPPYPLIDYSLHFAKVDKDDTIQSVKSAYYITDVVASASNLSYLLNLSEADSGTYLICFYYNCEEKNNKYECTREIIKEKSYKFIYTENEDIENEIISDPPILIPLFAGVLGLTVMVAFVQIFMYIRRRQLQSQEDTHDTVVVHYAELDLMSNHSGSNTPREKEEVLYSEIAGILTSKIK